MKNVTPKLVALDIGGVCISLHPERIMKRFGTIQSIFHAKNLRPYFNLLETGKIPLSDLLAQFRKITGNKYSDAELIEIWDSMLGDSLPGMADAVRSAVARGWRFVYFSNTSAVHMEHFLRTNDFCHLVTGAIFSYEAGALKPDPAIYEAFEIAYGVPEIYFDDNADNIAAGRARGWNSVQFTSPDQLNTLLR